MTFTDYPLKFSDYREALETALEESVIHKDWFLYFLRNNAGYYVIDFQGVAHSDEHLIMILTNGEAHIL